MEIVYFITCSLDGYIATPDGDLDWLKEFEGCGEDHGYQAFFESIDGLILGRNTFDQILQFGDWPYSGRPSWVFTSQPRQKWPDQVQPLAMDPIAGRDHLQKLGLKRLWLVGGSQLAGAFRAKDLISEYWISFLPLLLGRGKPMLEPCNGLDRLELVESRTFGTGLIQVRYRKSNPE